MITIAQLIRGCFMPLNRKYRGLLVLTVLAVLSGCGNSKLLLSPLYNRLDDQIRKEFHKLGEFNDEQVQSFEDRVGTFHVWHRQSELPKYASLLRDIQQSIKVRGETTHDRVGQWMKTSETHTKSIRQCHPVNFSYALMNTLTDEQINFIQRRFARERRMNREKYFERTPEQRVERRHGNIIKWAGRLDFEFTETQKRLLKETLKEQTSLRKQYYALSDRWNRKLFFLARKQDSPTYTRDMDQHVKSLWTLLEDTHTNDWEANRRLWQDFGHAFVQSMTGDQRKKASIWIGKLADTLDAISADKPSFQVKNDARLGCSVKPQTG